jgi:DNA-3-methyladenine glycosylase II
MHHNLFSTRLVLKPRSPFDFMLSAEIFEDGDEQIQKFQNGRYWKTINVDETLVLLCLRGQGTADDPVLIADLKSNKPLSNRERNKIRSLITLVFNLDLDLNPFYETVKQILSCQS